jgi:hypothetical protein
VMRGRLDARRTLKSLVADLRFNRDDYTNSKTDFIQKYTEKAKLEYGDRY